MTDLNLWNKKSIDSPPFITLEYTKQEYEKLFKNTTFNVLFTNQLELLNRLFSTSKNQFLEEKSILDKLIYKNWNALRKEKSLQNMRKLKRILNSFVDLKLDSLIETISMLSNKSVPNQTNVCIPSRGVYEYLLVRLFASFNLLQYSVDLIRSKIFFYLIKQIKNAVFLSNNIVYMSTIARLYCFIRKYKQQICFLYNSLREYIELFKSSQVKWSEEFSLDQFPEKLVDKPSEIEFDLNKLVVENDLITRPIEMMEKNQIETSFPLEMDLGEKIEREEVILEDFNEKYRKEFLENVKIILLNSSDSIDLKLIKKKLSTYFKRTLKKRIRIIHSFVF